MSQVVQVFTCFPLFLGICDCVETLLKEAVYEGIKFICTLNFLLLHPKILYTEIKEEGDIMEQKLELGRRVLQLSETTLEGLEHVRQRAAKGYFKETFSLFYDVVSSFHEMEKVVYSMSPELKENALEERAVEVSEAMKLVLSAYEGYNELRPLEILQFTLLPRYRDWQRELREALEPLIVS